jgi:hypothetical protein
MWETSANEKPTLMNALAQRKMMSVTVVWAAASRTRVARAFSIETIILDLLFLIFPTLVVLVFPIAR